MITGVIYTDNTTFIQHDNDKAITTDKLSFSQAFHFARINEIDFDYEIIDKNDEEDFSEYLQYQIGNCNNTNISQFFNLLEKNGIRKIINNPDLLGRKGVRNTISNIIDDYNNNIALYNIECYGTDTYIAKILYEHLTIYNNNLTEKNSQVDILLKLVDVDTYDLNVFLDIVKIFTNCQNNELNENTDTEKIKQLKKEFNEAYSYSSEALEDYISYLSTYGGDYNYQIVQAMNKCFDDIINNKPFCDRKGLIEAINNETHT